MMRKKIVWILSGLLLLFFAIPLLQPKPTKVEVGRVTRGTVLDVVTSVSSGTLEPRESRAVGSDVGGLVLEVLKRPGERVAAGDVVLTLDPGDLSERVRMEQLNLASARAALREAQVRVDQTGNDYRKAYDLYKEGVFSRKQAEAQALAYRAAQAEVETVRTNLQKLESSIGLAQQRLDDTKLKAPIAGVVQAVHVTAGQMLIPKQPGFEVMDASTLQIGAVIDEVDARRVSVDQEVRITADAVPGQSVRGRLTWVAPVVSISKRASRGVEIEVEVVDHLDALRVGMSVEIEIVVGTSTNTLSVSGRAVTDLNGKPSVYRIERRGRRLARLEVRVIRPGIRTFNRVEVLDGLAEGDEVVLNVEDKLRPGMRVDPVEAPHEAAE